MKVKNCFVCGENSFKELNEYGSNSLSKCLNCGFVFYRLIPSQVEIDNIYSNYSRDTSITNSSIDKNNEIAKKLINFVKNSDQQINVLDIGCGEGYLLEQLMKHGCKAYGTEFDSESVNICKSKGINMIAKKKLLPDSSPNIKFDIVIMGEVIEHIDNPKEVVGGLYELLKEGGVFYFTTPNFNSLERRVFGSKWGNISPPEHLAYYVKSTINKLMVQSGFKKLYLKSDGISIFRVMQALNSQNSKMDRDEELIARRFQSTFSKNLFLSFLKKMINLLLNITGLGSSLYGVYRK